LDEERDVVGEESCDWRREMRSRSSCRKRETDWAVERRERVRERDVWRSVGRVEVRSASWLVESK
jgi:hypothetical protein